MRHYSSLTIAVAALTLLLPLSAEANATLTATDSIAGLGMTVTVSAAAPSSDSLLTLSNPDGKQMTLPVHTDAQGNASVNVDGKMTQTAGTYTVSLSNASQTPSTVSVAVLPETMDPAISELQAWTPHIRADGSDAADITVTLRDKYGNILPGRPVALVSSRNSDVITALTPETGKDGTQHFSLTTEADGTLHIRAVDLLSGNTLSSAADIQAGQGAMGGDAPVATASSYDPQSGRQFYAQVGSAPAFDLVDSFEVTAPPSLAVGVEAQKVTIRAIDKNGNTVENYVGTVVFESTDPSATLPNFGTYTFKDRDLGEKSFPLVLTFKTPGQQIFRVKDQSNPAITGSATIAVGGGTTTGAHGITITSHKDGDSVNSLNITITGTGPAYANLTVMGGTQDVTGTSGSDGTFSIPITLSADQHDFTIRVQDDTKQNDSGPLHLILDTVPPTIGDITFAPTQPNSGDKVLVIVQSEPGLAQMTINVDGNTPVTLTENPTASGSYQGFFTAPAGGSYQPDITAVDKAGNATDVRTTFSVGLDSLPTVLNVKAEARVNAVALQWDPLSIATLDGYRVYVGESPQNFLYTLDTGRVTTKATVAGLTPGKTYYFTVTALKGTIESGSKSDVVQAVPLGLTLNVTPSDSALKVEWTALSTDVPLSGFILDYGTDATNYTETRTLNPALRDYTMRDLLNGVPYFMRLTPVTVTGDKLTDLAATGQGTPDGNGFHAGPNDPVPGNLSTTPGNVHPAPSNSSSGLPTSAWLAIAFLGLVGAAYGWHRRNRARHADAFLQAIQSQYYR